MAIAGMMLLVAVLITIPFVQNWLVKQVTHRLSKDLNTTVQIRHIDFDLAFFNKMALEGTLVKDHHKDTLLYAGKVKVRITDWFFLKDTIVLKYIGLEDASVNLHRIDSIWNYAFLTDYFSGSSSGKKKTAINLDLKTVELNNIRLLRKDEWRGEDLLFHVRSLLIDARQISLAEQNIQVNSVQLTDPFFSVYNYKGRRPKKILTGNEPDPPATDTALKWNPGGWTMLVKQLTIHNGIFKTSLQTNRPPHPYFDGANVSFSAINSSFSNIRLDKDTVTANVLLDAKERSGFTIQSLTALFTMHPQGMAFTHLDIRTNKSRLRNFFAIHYREFSDLSDFTDKVNMEGVFANSTVESDDIAFFAPEAATWKKRISITATIKGTVAHLSAKNAIIKAGKNSFLNGNLKIVGLPDLDKTFIDFKANDFSTTYADVVAFLPQVKKIRELRLDRLQYLRYKGYFTGFIRDFIASGTITTGLGTIISDAHLKIPEKGAAAYSGRITTTGFNAGSLVDNSQLGRVAFNGTVKGHGFSLSALQAELDGTIQSIEFNHYRYTHLTVKGKLTNRLFNGDFSARDSNLVARLSGLIDFGTAVPRFNFSAGIESANLKRLHLMKDDIDIHGQVLFNFTGSTIDNFLGEARIYDAAIFRDGQRISFDSLRLSSTIGDSGKTITVSSNEFDARLQGDFSIKALPRSFQTYLNRYYPSYINPTDVKLINENFSFSVTTKNINDYLGLVNNDLKGFNFSTLGGHINSARNEFDFNASIPQFGYKNIGFYRVALDGKGNLDTLTLTNTIGDVFVNDSLHFPGTEINVQSSHDLSRVNIITSASQALNAANISGQVQTLKNGVRILFNPSTFDINGKKWTISKDGELVLSKELVKTGGLRISNEEQEVYVASVPAGNGTANDLSVQLKKINIGDFAPFFSKDNRLEGLLNANIHVSELFDNMHVDVQAEAGQFRLDDDSLGRLLITSTYVKNTGKITTAVVSDNKGYDFDLNGVFNILDSAKQDIDLNFNLRNTDIHILEKYLSGIFSRLSGNATGNLRVVGPARNLKYLGDIRLANGGLMVNYTKCYYRIPAANVSLQDGTIDFGSFTLFDTLNNSAELVKGRLDHQAFKDLAFNFSLRSNQLLLLNTTAADNNQFYGTMVGKVNMSFTGPLEDMHMDIKGEPTDTSDIYLPIGSSRESGNAGFIVWKVYGREMKEEDLNVRESNLTVSLDVTANRFANVFVILDGLTGDIISAKGNGNIKLRAGTKEDITMSGRFNIERGNYTFTFQALKRNFTLREGAGSYISWNGDPLAATINIEAEYEADNVRFSDLLNNSNIAGAASEDVKRYRGKVLVVASLTERLTQPKIAFRIELPQNSPIRANADVATIFSFIENDINELNKQVSFLILFNTFGPYTAGGARGVGTGDIANKALEGIVVNSISGFLSNILTKEFSGILQDIFKDKSLKVNINASLYSGTNLIASVNPNQVALPDRTNFNLSIGRSFFNERVTFIVGGALDFGLNTAQQNKSSAFPFLPDVTAEWRLTPDGKFRLTFFYRENYSYISTTGKQNRSGSSISFRKEFDSIDELFRKRKK